MVVNSQALISAIFAFGLYVAWISIVHGSITCIDSIPASCSDAALSGTNFLNNFGHLTPSDAEEAMTTTFGSNSPTDSCFVDLGLFACRVFILLPRLPFQ